MKFSFLPKIVSFRKRWKLWSKVLNKNVACVKVLFCSIQIPMDFLNIWKSSLEIDPFCPKDKVFRESLKHYQGTIKHFSGKYDVKFRF